MENSRFKIQDLTFQRILPEKQQITILYYTEKQFCFSLRTLWPPQ